MSGKLRVLAVVALLGGMLWRHTHLQTPSGGPEPSSLSASPPTTGTQVVGPAGEASKPATWRLGQLELTACQLSRPNSGVTTAAWCTPFEVPEHRDVAGGDASPASSRKITLKLAVIRSDAEVASRDMLVFLDGGPGEAATEDWAQISPALKPLLAHRHVVLLDQRGTGGSNPLSCKAQEKDDEEAVNTPPVPDAEAASFSKQAEQVRANTERCLKALADRADPSQYTTTIAARDLEDVRKALGAPTFDLIGVSYGTRMAQQYAMRYPDAVRSLVLDGVVPNPLILGSEIAQNLEEALKAQFARCTNEPACLKRYGDPYQTLSELRSELRAHPHDVSFRDPQSFAMVTRKLNEGALIAVVRLFAYHPLTAALLPLSIDAAAHGDVTPLLAQSKLITGDLVDRMDSGMAYSVLCAEDADLLAPRPEDEKTLLGSQLAESFKTLCQVWPKGVRPADFHQPLQTVAPVLLLSGQYDPITPPRYGDEVAKGLPNARHLVLRGQGHNVIGVGCAPQLVKQFVETLKPEALDVGCLDRLQAAPIFLGYNGGEP